MTNGTDVSTPRLETFLRWWDTFFEYWKITALLSVLWIIVIVPLLSAWAYHQPAPRIPFADKVKDTPPHNAMTWQTVCLWFASLLRPDPREEPGPFLTGARTVGSWIKQGWRFLTAWLPWSVDYGRLNSLADAVGDLHPLPKQLDLLTNAATGTQVVRFAWLRNIFTFRSIKTTAEKQLGEEQGRKLVALITGLSAVYHPDHVMEILRALAGSRKKEFGDELGDLVKLSTSRILLSFLGTEIEKTRSEIEAKFAEAQREATEAPSANNTPDVAIPFNAPIFPPASLQQVGEILRLVGNKQIQTSGDDCLRIRNYSNLADLCVMVKMVYPVDFRIGKPRTGFQPKDPGDIKYMVNLVFEYDNSLQPSIGHSFHGPPIKELLTEATTSSASASSRVPESPLEDRESNALALRTPDEPIRTRRTRKASSYYNDNPFTPAPRIRRTLGPPRGGEYPQKWFMWAIEGAKRLLRARGGIDLLIRAKTALLAEAKVIHSWEVDNLDLVALSTIRNYIRDHQPLARLGPEDGSEHLAGFNLKLFFAVAFMDLTATRTHPLPSDLLPCIFRLCQNPIVALTVRTAWFSFKLDHLNSPKLSAWWYTAFLEAVFGSQSDQLELFEDQMRQGGLLGNVKDMYGRITLVVAAYGDPCNDHDPGTSIQRLGVTTIAQDGAFALVPRFVFDENLGDSTQTPLMMVPTQLRMGRYFVGTLQSHGGVGSRTTSRDLRTDRHLPKMPPRQPQILYCYEHFYIDVAKKIVGWRYWTEEANQIVNLDALMSGLLEMRVATRFLTATYEAEDWQITTLATFLDTLNQRANRPHRVRWVVQCESVIEKRVAIQAAWLAGKRILHFQGRDLEEGMSCAEAIRCPVVICSADGAGRRFCNGHRLRF